jgi:hypothetical protein
MANTTVSAQAIASFAHDRPQSSWVNTSEASPPSSTASAWVEHVARPLGKTHSNASIATNSNIHVVTL